MFSHSHITGRISLLYHMKTICTGMSLSVSAEPPNIIKSRAQYAVLQTLGIKKILMVVGFSMGGQQVRWMLVVLAY